MEFFPLRPVQRLLRDPKFHREEGNKLFASRQLFKALESYNKSLLVADPQTEREAIFHAYANRSAVYITAKEYVLCLENIDLARKYGNPPSTISVLDERENRCRSEMAVGKPNEEPWSFFKLSHAANVTIPFIANCLELKRSAQFGRHIVTTKDLNPGDIIAIEEPFFVELATDVLHLRCAYCAKSKKMSLIIHESFPFNLFCSEMCAEKAVQIIPFELRKQPDILLNAKYLFESLSICGGSFEKLEQLMEDPALSSATVFDFDFSDPNSPNYKYQMLLAFNSLCRSPLQYQQKCFIDEKASQLESQLEFLESREQKQIAKKFIYRFYEIACNVLLLMDWRVPVIPCDHEAGLFDKINIGPGVFPFAGLINMSCFPNIDRIVVDNKFVFYARRPIKKSEQLFMTLGLSYLGVPRDIRKIHYKVQLNCTCTCEACVGNFPTSAQHMNNHNMTRLKSSKMADWKKEFKKNYKISELFFKNRFLLSAIAQVEPAIFYFM